MSNGWPIVRLRHITVDVKSWNPSKVPEFTYVDISSIDNNRCEIVDAKRLAGSEAPSRARRPIQDGDVLFSNVRTYLRNVAHVRGLKQPAVASTGFTLLRPAADLDSRFLYHLARSDFFIGQVTPEQTGTHYPATSDRVVRDQEVPLPGVAEQRSIAALIDKIEFSRHTSTAHLLAARHAIERFRQAVLAAACSGRLTADWRQANPGAVNVEHALIESMALRRRRKHAEQRVELDLPDLPESYYVASIGDASLLLEYGTSQRAESYAEHGVPVLRMGNIQDGHLDLGDLKYRALDAEMERLILQDGDLLFNRTNSPELVGKAAVFHSSEPMSFASYLIRVRFEPNVADSDFVNYWINSAWGRAWARLAKTDGVSQSNINGSKLSLMPIPLPPIEEQREIVRRASGMLKLADELLFRVDSATRRVERSSQAVLAKVFRGELTGVLA